MKYSIAIESDKISGGTKEFKSWLELGEYLEEELLPGIPIDVENRIKEKTIMLVILRD